MRYLRFAAMGFAAALSACGTAGTHALPGAQPSLAQMPAARALPPAAPPKRIYIAIASFDSSVPGTLLVFPIGAAGNVAPTASISGKATLLQQPLHVAANNAGHIYSTDWPGVSSGFHALGFASNATGNAAPISVLKVPYGRVVAFDASGNLYCGYFSNNSHGQYGAIAVYPPNASGNTKPIRQIIGPKTQLWDPEGMTFDAQGRLYVGNGGTDLVLVFAPNANGNVAPVSSFHPHTSNDYGVVVGPHGIYVLETGHIGVYPIGSSGYATPTQYINIGPNGDNGIGLGVDRSGYIYTADGGANTIDVFAPNATGNAKPVRTIKGSKTKLTHLLDLTVH